MSNLFDLYANKQVKEVVKMDIKVNRSIYLYETSNWVDVVLTDWGLECGRVRQGERLTEIYHTDMGGTIRHDFVDSNGEQVAIFDYELEQMENSGVITISKIN